MDEALRALLMDSRLSADARVIGLYVASLGPGAHEIDRDTLMDLLGSDAGKGRVQRAVAKLQRFGWVRRTEGGRGHFPRFEFRGRESEPLKQIGAAKTGSYTDRGRESEPLNPPRTRDKIEVNSSPSSPTTAPTRARREDLDRLRGYLGEYADAVDQMDASAEHPPSWAAVVYGTYCREPSVDPLLDRVPSNERPAVIALALHRYAAEGGVYNGPYFRSFVQRAMQDRANGAANVDTPAPNAPPPCSIEDLKTLLEHGGTDLHMVETRPLAFADLERDFPDVWARAGPWFVRLQHFNRLADLLRRGDDFGLNRAIREQLGRIQRERAA